MDTTPIYAIHCPRTVKDAVTEHRSQRKLQSPQLPRHLNEAWSPVISPWRILTGSLSLILSWADLSFSFAVIEKKKWYHTSGGLYFFMSPNIFLYYVFISPYNIWSYFDVKSISWARRFLAPSSVIQKKKIRCDTIPLMGFTFFIRLKIELWDNVTCSTLFIHLFSPSKRIPCVCNLLHMFFTKI